MALRLSTAGMVLAGAALLTVILTPEVVRRALSSDEFMPHGHCYFWQPRLVWLHAVSDGLIALAYLSIPITLFILVGRRQDLPFNRVFLLFGAFVLSCGLTHIMDVWTIWVPTYWLAGGLKAVTAVVSLASAVVIARTLPRVLALPNSLKEVTGTNEALRASEERFRQVLEESPVGMVLMDERGILTLVNRKLERMFGYGRAELLGNPVEMLIPERLRGSHSKHRASFFADPRPRAMGAGRELCGRRKDGSEIPIEIGLTPLLHADGPYVLGSVLDVSELRRADAIRRESMDALESFGLMVEGIKDYAIFQLDTEGTIKTWNSGARAINGYEADEIIGKQISIFYPPGHVGKAHEELEIAAATGRYEEVGWRVRKDGSYFWANVVISALPGPQGQGVRGFVKVTRDLSEHKRAEDAQTAALAERTAMLQEIHHRVKNNLQMIASLLNLQARQIQDSEARSIFLEARGRVRSIALLHESLYQSADLGRVDMHEYVSKLVVALQQTFGGAGGAPRIVQNVEEVHFSVDTAVPCGLIIHELVMNALKHAFVGMVSAQDEIRIEIAQGADGIRLTVADSGAGFASTVNPAADETMGLTLIRDLTAQLRGTVGFANANGARCTVTFPAPSSAYPVVHGPP
jgi:PAS domain S-box-containing protein